MSSVRSEIKTVILSCDVTLDFAEQATDAIMEIVQKDNKCPHGCWICRLKEATKLGMKLENIAHNYNDLERYAASLDERDPQQLGI